jgi:hypothetical protein
MPCQTDRGDYSAAPPYRLMAPRNQENGSPRRVSQCPGFARRARRYGGVAEWLKAHAWKACLRETVTWVRIPPPPPRSATPCGSAFSAGRLNCWTTCGRRKGLRGPDRARRPGLWRPQSPEWLPHLRRAPRRIRVQNKRRFKTPQHGRVERPCARRRSFPRPRGCRAFKRTGI